MDKITSPNRFEKLEKLDPDMDIDNESSSSAKSSRSTDSEKKRGSNHKSSKSSSHHRSKGTKESESLKTAKDKGHPVSKSESSQYNEEEIQENGGKEAYLNGDVNRSSSTHSTSLESSEISQHSIDTIDELTKEDSNVTESDLNTSKQLTDGMLKESSQKMEDTKKEAKGTRISYTRVRMVCYHCKTHVVNVVPISCSPSQEQLLSLKSHPLSLHKPKQLDNYDL